MDYPIFSDYRSDIISATSKEYQRSIRLEKPIEKICFSKEIVSLDSEVTGIIYWIKITQNDFFQLSEKCCYVLSGIAPESFGSNRLYVQGSIHLGNPSKTYCPDN